MLIKTFSKKEIRIIYKNIERLINELENEFKEKNCDWEYIKKLLFSFSIKLFIDNEYAKFSFSNNFLKEECFIINFTKEENLYIFEKLFDTIESALKEISENFILNNKKVFKSLYKENIENLNKINKKDIKNEQDIDFFELDEVMENSKNLTNYIEHKIKEKEKMSADELVIDQEIIDELHDLIENYKKQRKYIKTMKDFLESKEFYIDLLLKFDTILKLSGEFYELSKSFEILIKIILEINENKLNDKFEFFIKFLDSIMEDIEKWYEEILLYKTAKDIHYLDASLLSSIEQLNFILN